MAALLATLLLILFALGGWHLIAAVAAALADPIAFVLHDVILILAALLAYHVLRALFDDWRAARNKAAGR